MNVAQKDLYDRASRAMFVLLKKCNTLSLLPGVTIELVDKMILPILTYGCELWGFDIKDLIQRLQLRYYKLVLTLKNQHHHL